VQQLDATPLTGDERRVLARGELSVRIDGLIVVERRATRLLGYERHGGTGGCAFTTAPGEDLHG
jgi:hypothetical protein